MVEPLVATKELPEPVTLAAGVPEPHCAEMEVASASTAVMMEKLTMLDESWVERWVERDREILDGQHCTGYIYSLLHVSTLERAKFII